MTDGRERDTLMGTEEALSMVLAAVPGPTEPEWVNLADALGRVTAGDVTSAIDLPPWDNSAMDGYAVRHADVAAATDLLPVRLAVIGDVAAGASPQVVLRHGTAIRIATGARIPGGADSVVPVELTSPADTDGTPAGPRGRDAAGPLPAAILVHQAVPARGSIRERASDLRAGANVLSAGSVIGPPQVAIVAGAGHAGLSVHRRPIVGILATGDELRAPGTDLGASGIPDANGPALRACVEDAGGIARSLGIASDRLDDVRVRLAAGLAERPDAIIVSGGVSVGPYDHVRSAFAELGDIALWRVAVQPGKPFAFGTAPRPGGGTPILLFGLPGNPVSTFVTFELFVRPALRRLGGRRAVGRRVDRAVLMDSTPKSAGRRAFIRVRAERDAHDTPVRDAQGRVVVRLAGGVGGQGSHVLSALAEADALAIIPEESARHSAGDAVDLWWLDGS
ncbi:MAG: gephyrin-like molybdotransferase Glp [Chloroflexota bacterium]